MLDQTYPPHLCRAQQSIKFQSGGMEFDILIIRIFKKQSTICIIHDRYMKNKDNVVVKLIICINSQRRML